MYFGTSWILPLEPQTAIIRQWALIYVAFTFSISIYSDCHGNPQILPRPIASVQDVHFSQSNSTQRAICTAPCSRVLKPTTRCDAIWCDVLQGKHVFLLPFAACERHPGLYRLPAELSASNKAAPKAAAWATADCGTASLDLPCTMQMQMRAYFGQTKNHHRTQTMQQEITTINFACTKMHKPHNMSRV